MTKIRLDGKVRLMTKISKSTIHVLIYDADVGEDIKEVAKNMVWLAAKKNVVVVADFNNVRIIVKPSDTTRRIVDYYRWKS